MELRQLECFLAVVEEGTFTAAAERLHLVQSGVSATIRNLERDLDVRLFERSAGTGRPTLTAAGTTLVPQARGMLDAARAARESVRATGSELTGTVDIGILSSLSAVDLPGVLRRYADQAPGVQIRLHLRPQGSRELLDAVVSGGLDAAFVAPSGELPPGLRVRELAMVEMRLLLPAGHRLAGRRRVSLAEVAEERWIDSPTGFGNRVIVDAAFVRAGLTRTIAVQVPDLELVPGLVAAGVGLGFYPGRADHGTVPGVVPVRLDDREQPHWQLSLATRRGVQRPAVKLFAELLSRYATPTPEDQQR
jgi:DNA-binding transcriptional LysR family regulator